VGSYSEDNITGGRHGQVEESAGKKEHLRINIGERSKTNNFIPP